MGSHLNLHSLPMPFELTAKELEELFVIVDELSPEDLQEVADEGGMETSDMEVVRRQLRNDVDSLSEIHEDRMAVFFWGHEMPFGYYLAGGSTSSDLVSDLQETIIRLSACPELLHCLRVMAFSWAQMQRISTRH